MNEEQFIVEVIKEKWSEYLEEVDENKARDLIIGALSRIIVTQKEEIAYLNMLIKSRDKIDKEMKEWNGIKQS